MNKRQRWIYARSYEPVLTLNKAENSRLAIQYAFCHTHVREIRSRSINRAIQLALRDIRRLVPRYDHRAETFTVALAFWHSRSSSVWTSVKYSRRIQIRARQTASRPTLNQFTRRDSLKLITRYLRGRTNTAHSSITSSALDELSLPRSRAVYLPSLPFPISRSPHPLSLSRLSFSFS